MTLRHRSAPRWWATRGAIAILLLPLTALFFCVQLLRRYAYRHGLRRSTDLPVPVVVVGNLAVGGSGKTPTVVWLVESLRARGWQPGVISRGYGGDIAGIREVRPDSDPRRVGDEPVLITRRSAVPVWVGRDRVAAARALLAAHPATDVLVADDGLQHYRLARTCEILVLDPATLGNRWLLPSGPLREPLRRAAQTDVALLHAGESSTQERPPCLPAGLPVFPMRLQPGLFYRLDDPARRCGPEALAAKRLRAVAGIGRPQRFFDTLTALGLALSRADAFPDHHRFSATELELGDCDALLITEKDAIKCAGLAPPETWVLPVEARIPDAALLRIDEVLRGRKTA